MCKIDLTNGPTSGVDMVTKPKAACHITLVQYLFKVNLCICSICILCSTKRDDISNTKPS